MMTVKVEDKGVGMSEEIRSRLFTPQMTSLSEARIEKKGAGIGLFLVKGFVETSGGSIRVESKEGEGSVFSFTLPLTAAESVAEPSLQTVESVS
jgi:two-component system CheB/CheR fusion protein